MCVAAWGVRSAARSDIGFQYVRFHGIFDDDMSTYLNGAVNMFNVFSTLDFLLSIGMRPIVEVCCSRLHAHHCPLLHVHAGARAPGRRCS